MATQDYEDDFDQILDHIDFGAIGDDVWDAIQTQNQTTASPRFSIDSHSQPPRISEGDSTVIVTEFVQGTSTSPDPAVEPRRANTPSIAYSSDDVEDLNDDFFQQLDEVENQIMNSARATAPPTMVPSESSNTLEASFNNVYDIGSPPMKRRRLEDCNERLASPTKKGKGKFEGDWSELLDEYDDELNCPVCCDIFFISDWVSKFVKICQNLNFEVFLMPSATHAGNASIIYRPTPSEAPVAGQIQRIENVFTDGQNSGIRLHVRSYVRLAKSLYDPFVQYPHLQATTYSSILKDTEDDIGLNDIIAHAARYDYSHGRSVIVNLSRD
ncbi:hypothetical protein GGU10DRAFT_436527 [Lentinula aff. detonsa]|uniref:Uncharacterized protein n=1 Tax=Lentinula aff. detonsa TaxID=2804958 RepID=A0AA38KCW8_9AGAR|nr:hypothetical protein GGU10DRAFT_436527 [Lentinula aff. detonsa]